MSRLPVRPLFTLALGLLATVAFAAEGAPASITKLNDKGQKIETGNFPESFVFSETVDGLEFVVDDAKSQNRLTLKYRTYDIEYKDPASVEYLKGKAAEEAGAPDKAYDAFAKAASGAKFPWVKEESLLRGATAALQVKKFDEALALVATLEKDAPRSKHLANALLVRGQAQTAKGDAPGAAKTFATLTAMAKDWGEGAAILGARGQAASLTANKQYAEAADILVKLMPRIDPAKSKAEYVGLALDLADNQQAAGKGDDAIATLRAAVYREVEPALQARAHLAWARILAQKTDAASLAAAFDQAAIANALRGAEPATIAAAKAVAASVVDKLAKDPAVSAADKAEYKRVLPNF